MMTPDPCFTIDGSSPRSRRTAASKFWFNAACQSSSLRAAKPPPGAEEPPTLLTRISTPLRRSRTWRMTFSTPSAVLMSAATNSSGWGRLGGADRAVVTTVAPECLSRWTIASPMPLVPPVTRARLPLNSVSEEPLICVTPSACRTCTLSGQGRATRARGPLQREVRRRLDSRCSHDRGLLYDVIRPPQQGRRDREAERLGGLGVDHQLELRRLLHGQVSGLCALQDLVHKRGAA